MRASIVIPCYNQQEYVCNAIDSALDQTHGDTEVIVVNDGSTDDSVGRILSMCTNVILINQENAGLAAARNAGFKVASGEFFLPLDADDYITPDYLERTLPFMSDPKVGIVATDMQYFDLGSTRVPPLGLTLKDEMRDNLLPVCSLIRRTAFEQAGGYKTRFIERNGNKISIFEDWELWVGIMKLGWRAAAVNEPLFYHRIKSSSKLDGANSFREELKLEHYKMHQDLYGAN